MKLEEKLVSLRKEKRLSQMKLAEMMNVSRQAVSRWEVGSAVPSTDNLKFLGRLYGVSLEYLLHDDAPEPEKNDFTEFTLSNGGTMPRKILRRNKTKIRLYYLVSFLVLLAAVAYSAVNLEYRKVSIVICLVVMLVEIFRCVKTKELSLFRGIIALVIFVVVLMI